MSIEQKLRENLEAAGNSLIVPTPRRSPLIPRTRSWKQGLPVAIAGAAAVLVLAVPALLLWSGDRSTVGDAPLVVGSADGETTAPPTSPTTTSPVATTSTADLQDSTMATLGEIRLEDHDLRLVAKRVDEEDPPTATVALQATPIGGSKTVDEVTVGNPAGFFWHSLTGAEAVCEFSADTSDTGADIVVQLLLSPSLGCSETYRFSFESRDLSLVVEAPEDAAQMFVAAWDAGDTEMMAELAEATAVRQAEELRSQPEDPVYSYCEGAAGSVYCTFEVERGELVIRVRSEQPARVIEVIYVGDN